MKRIILACLFATFLFSCSLDEDYDEFNYSTKLLPIDEITFPDSFNYEGQYNIKFKYTLVNGCYSYDQLYYAVKDSTRTIAVYAYVDESGDSCSEGEIQEEDEFILTVSQTEDYVFKIWKGTNDQDEDVYEEYIVPVLEADEQ